jgi:hypothetical protein
VKLKKCLVPIFTLSLVASPLPAAEPQPKTPFRVCLDPGHPSENNDGRELLNGVREVEISYTVVLTKSSLGEYVTRE